MSALAMPLRRARAVSLRRPELWALLALAAALDLYALSRNGWANDYYSGAVRSMASNWHAFLYGSFDASGVMTVDKPPLALWVQALSVRAFGLSSWSILVPQALMGVATVGLTYDLVRRRFGRAAGFAGGLVLALTPITVAISRHNNPDALLVLCCVAAVWALVRALEDGRTRWLLLCGLCVGLAFETKMLVGLMVVPAMAVAYLWVAPGGRAKALRQLLAGGAVMAVVGLAWPVLMWLTPASDRPWISGTSDNSIWSLIFGYTGFGRIAGQAGGPGGVGGPGGGNGGGPFGGSPGVWRLFNDALGGQAAWLLGFAAVAGVALLVTTRLRRADARTGWLIAVGGSFLTIAVAFSQASGIFHPYYVSLLAPFTAVLVGAGVGRMLEGDRTMRIAGPLAVAAGVAAELVVLHDNPTSLTWLPPVLIGGGFFAAYVLSSNMSVKLRRGAVAGVLALLLIAPAAWSVQTLGHATSSTFPAGGPASASAGMGGAGGGGFPGGAAMRGGPPPGGVPQPGGFAPGGMGGGGPFGGNAQATQQAVAYAKAHGGGTVAVSSQNGAASTLITTGANVVAIGGFSGRESQVSVAWLADAVRAGKIRFVLTDGGSGMPNDSRVGSSQVMAVVAQVGRKVSSVSGLYDLRGKADALDAAAV